MTTLTISPATLARAEKNAILPFDDSGVERRPDGMCDVPVSAGLLARIEEQRFPGESIDDCVSRILSIVEGALQ